MPEKQGDDHGPELEEEPAVRQCEADCLEQREEPLRKSKPEEEADDRGHHAHRQRLDDDGEPHLTARCAERAQRRKLARALRDRDRERVDDHERTDEERDHPEGEEEVAKERDELIRVLGVLGRLGVTGPDLGVRGQDLAGSARRAAGA